MQALEVMRLLPYVGSFSGETVETWIAFITKGDVEASDSLFTGELVVS